MLRHVADQFGRCSRHAVYFRSKQCPVCARAEAAQRSADAVSRRSASRELVEADRDCQQALRHIAAIERGLFAALTGGAR